MDFEQNQLFGWFANGANALTSAQVLAAFVTAFATIALWRVTKLLAKETSLLASLTSQPFVIAALKSSDENATALDLSIQNTGNATAFNIRLFLSPKLRPPNRPQPSHDTKGDYNVSLLPPGQILSVDVAYGPEIHDVAYSVELSWTTHPQSKDRQNLSYKITARDGFQAGWNKTGMKDIVDELGKLREAVRNMQ
jgi:hypothetical protein